MEITVEKLVDYLNKDIEIVYSAAIQYINHGAADTCLIYSPVIQ